jgi:hypothetical protein
MNQYDLQDNNKAHSQKSCLYTLIGFAILALWIFLASCSPKLAAPAHPTESSIYIDKAPQK